MDQNSFSQILPRIADMFAIPLFALSLYYFYNIKNKNNIEYLLLIFSAIGLSADIFFVYLFLHLRKFKMSIF
jgi:hypothetical protein